MKAILTANNFIKLLLLFLLSSAVFYIALDKRLPYAAPFKGFRNKGTGESIWLGAVRKSESSGLTICGLYPGASLATGISVREITEKNSSPGVPVWGDYWITSNGRNWVSVVLGPQETIEDVSCADADCTLEFNGKELFRPGVSVELAVKKFSGVGIKATVNESGTLLAVSNYKFSGTTYDGRVTTFTIFPLNK